ncbi:hypothetical protein [Pantoea ananatis]|uniref:hypothetical protein n=1 Tax=Pantoea ananas TaxID=553 RepID=UPI003C20474F
MMTNETTAPHTPERVTQILTQMRHGMNIMRLAMESSEGVSLTPEMLSFLDQWIENIDEASSCAAGASLSA